MYGQPPRFHRPNGGRGQQPPQQQQPPFNPNYLLNNNYYLQPNFQFPFPNIPIQNPSFDPHNQLANNRGVHVNGTIERIDKAVVKGRRELIAAGENVSALKVSQGVLVVLQADSWDSLGVQMQQVPSLYRLMAFEGKINAFINCFVGVWKITTLSDLETAICKNEGVQQFEELELGPLIRHPLVNHYFSVSSNSTGVFKISSREILTFLVEFMDIHEGKEVKADELLDFIAKKRSVDSKEKLHVRIQSLGLHISLIRKASAMENATIKKYFSVPIKKNNNRPLLTLQKKKMDENFSIISERIKSFTSEHNKHIRFKSSSSEDDADDIDSDDEDETCLTSQSKNSSQDMKNSDRVSSCPYPSATEEKTRLGIVSEKENTTCNEGVNKSNKKRKSDAIDCTSSASCKVPKGDGTAQGSVGIKINKRVKCKLKHAAMSLDHDSMMAFITLWKDVCKRKNVYEALKVIHRFYKVKLPKQLYKSYPLIGLINVAIRSIKRGMWDSMYDTFQTFEQQEEPVAESDGHAENVTIQTEQVNSPLVTKHAPKQHCEVSLEDILKKVFNFLKDNHDVMGDVNTSLGKNAIFLRNLYKCEVWLTQQFDVEKFESFGYGDFLTFIERNVSAVPSSFHKYFVTDTANDKSSLDACMSHQLLHLLVAQASHNLSEYKNITVQNVVELLTWQFPLIPFMIEKEGSLKTLEDIVKANKSYSVSKSVLFSAALLSHPNVKSSSETCISSKNAIEVLRSAPMLTDLNKWSHWDVLFAPFLGPLHIWLSNQTNTKDLLCLVTRSGNVIRIDTTATVDSFLEASIHGSSFQTAVNLLSLFAFYGGEQNVPVSLLKCHVEKAFKVIVNNNGISSASMFILECLAYLPKEFHSFAADLLLSGFRSVVKDAPLSILRQCRHSEDRLMLHEIGFSLGTMEWINDYNTFSFTEPRKSTEIDQETVTSTSISHVKRKEILSTKNPDMEKEEHKVVNFTGRNVDFKQYLSTSVNEEESTNIIERIRREEFGLDPDISAKEDSILKKQHARLGRALHCLSQELYSQDSHFLLELVQNADDNVYPCDVEPTLTFILQEGGVVVLNNEQGFSVENIKALCDVGNSTKKEPSAGYIGKKGIGFKSVFRVTDAPEIHSNGFHIKFDITDGQIGFVLPTVVPPCDVNLFSKLVSMNNDPTDEKVWKTCIVLPFRSNKSESFSIENLISMFSDLHPSLLLFLHRLECIRFRNLINDSFIIMRKEIVGDYIVNVSLGNEKMAWFVKSCKLQANHIRHDVQTTEISMALMLDLNDGSYIPKPEHQPVFAFLPLRNYGLKFIIQADFILPSSREEVDGDSPWNQWLLSEFPNLFVSAEVAFCSLPFFNENPAKGVSAFMSFVPLVGEVHGFFSCLPRMIISKLRISNCLLLEGDNNEWVPPCKVLRNWTEQTRSLLPDSLIKEHLGVGYLNKEIVLTDSLSRALGIEECGPKILIQIMTSLCRAGSLKSMGFSWLSSWLNVMYLMSVNGTQSDVISSLCEIPFIPLLDGTYAAVNDGTIWLNADNHGLDAFGNLYPTLRIVYPALFKDSCVENITDMLRKVGVQRLSAHEVLKVHILPTISDEKVKNLELVIEYLSFIMFHLESSCPECVLEKEHILSEVRNNAFISTNHGYRRLADVSIHFGKGFGNPIDMRKLINGTDMKWVEIDIGYLNHVVYKSETPKWRKFLRELGVTDFVKINKVEKLISDIPHTVLKNMMLDDDCISSGSTIVIDYDSQELMDLLSHVSSNGDREKGKYLLEVLDTLWDEVFSDKITGFCSLNGQNKPFKSSVIRILHSCQWLASSLDDKLHFPKDLFHNCETVHAVFGDSAPYAVPKVNNVKLLNDIGLKITVTLDDALSVLEVWRRSEKPFRASISQMSKFYTFIWNEMSLSKQKIMENLHSQDFIFVPYSCKSTHEAASGSFLSPIEVYWHDSTGSMEQTRSTYPPFDRHLTHHFSSKMLCDVYPGLHYFFVKEFGVAENPPLLSYLQSLLQLSSTSLPSQAAKTVFQVFEKWSDGLASGFLSSDDINYLKKNMEEKEMRILPTVQDKWVSLHQSFGLICWCDDEELKKEFKNLNNVDFLFLGELDTNEKQKLEDKISVLFQRLGIPSLSEVVTREAIYYGPTDSSFKTSLVSWALLYAQRYIYNIHPNGYSEFKHSGFKNLNSLKIVVVEKLFYKNIIKKFGIESNKRYECNSLLQDNILYVTRESDAHSLYMELSRFLVSGIPELPLANFLHMITTMAESGSTEEQMELFITNSQKLLKLPDEESPWLISTSAPEDDKDTPTSSGFSLDDSCLPKSTSAKKFGSNSSWPPVNWKTAPGFEYAVKTMAFNSGQMRRDVTEEFNQTDDDWIIEENPASTIPSVILEEHEALIEQSDSISDMNVDFKGQPDYAKNTVSSYTKTCTSATNLIEKDQLSLGTVTPQQVITGRTGEFVAFKYFSSKIGEKCVKWVNEVKESGLPYDIVVKGENNKKEYIEVKATSNARKDWFVITIREWQFAVEKGESFSIARVVLSEGKSAQITTYRNPLKLCQSGHLQLAILSSKQ
ncbi:putative histidine kinase/HSP90-like ATPase superfamily [Helianthus annuus]|uniref:Histidine kinase/HSP90-like ATPase superfamily n=1 Tax=Helianthus annuus TaxID=4232 RepID=A0A251VLR5_HELAN|nr:protein NO VEIN [Helianthus annuus]KAF5820234.1 putative histidine kinase/HSP90-like ATPase superfamily [Helianthus annuus]KAJ0620302.1 putative histidine kinase/HSP90-like ATPase superfamily [Helianthus annuus]